MLIDSNLIDIYCNSSYKACLLKVIIKFKQKNDIKNYMVLPLIVSYNDKLRMLRDGIPYYFSMGHN